MSRIEYRTETIPANENGCVRCALLERLRVLGQDGWHVSPSIVQPENPTTTGWAPASSMTVLLEREVPEGEAFRQKVAPGA